MTKATLEPHRSADGMRPGLDPKPRASVVNSVWALFTETVARQALSRRLIVLSVLFLLPIVFAVLMRRNDLGPPGSGPGYNPLFAEFVLIFFMIPHALVPLTALVYSSGMIQDEIEEQTITYLLVRPLPRWSIYVAKLAATLVVTVGLTAVFTAATYLVIGWGQSEYWADGAGSRMGKTIALFAVSLTAYDALFGFLSLLIRRAILLGVGYIILLEGVVANIDFVIRKVTVMYYFRVMSERWMNLSEVWSRASSRLDSAIGLETAPSLGECLATLSIASLTIVIVSCLLMGRREFRVKTPEGS